MKSAFWVVKVRQDIHISGNNRQFKLLALQYVLGSFPTCNVCNTAHEMMRAKKWNDNQKEIVLRFLRLHLKQQLTERLQLEKIKRQCKNGKGNKLFAM